MHGNPWVTTAVTIDNGDDAKDALDRITIPQDVLDRIAPTAVPRSSIIISDEPLSEETNYRTEFVAVLNNQSQGGFVTRQRTDDVTIADGNYWGDDPPLFQPNWESQTGNRRRRCSQYYYPFPIQRAGGKRARGARRPPTVDVHIRPELHVAERRTVRRKTRSV
jgi:hypothetical protein